MSSSSARRIATEVVVIVGSILLAFALDAWWEEQQEEARVLDVLETVADEFEREGASLDSIISVNRAGGVLQAEVLRVTAPAATPISEDSVSALIAAGSGEQIYDASFGALTSLLASGGLERIEDVELRRLLAGWPGELDDLLWEENQAQTSIDRVLESLEASGVMSEVPSLDRFWPVRVRLMFRAPAHREREARKFLIYELYTDDLERVRRRGADVARRIREYVDAQGG